MLTHRTFLFKVKAETNRWSLVVGTRSLVTSRQSPVTSHQSSLFLNFSLSSLYIAV